MRTLILTLAGLFFATQVCSAKDLHIVYSEYKPFIYKNINGNIAGLDYDILSGFCIVSGYDCTFESTSFNNVLKNIWEGTSDIGAGAIYRTFQRESNGLFSTPYLKTGLVAIVPYDFTGDLEALYSKTVGVKKMPQGTNMLQNCKKITAI